MWRRVILLMTFALVVAACPVAHTRAGTVGSPGEMKTCRAATKTIHGKTVQVNVCNNVVVRPSRDSAPAPGPRVAGIRLYGGHQDSYCRPSGSATTSFSTHDREVFARAQTTGWRGTHVAKFFFVGPGGRVRKTALISGHSSTRAVCAWLTIAGIDRPVGTWKVRLSLDAKQVEKQEFQITQPSPGTVARRGLPSSVPALPPDRFSRHSNSYSDSLCDDLRGVCGSVGMSCESGSSFCGAVLAFPQSWQDQSHRILWLHVMESNSSTVQFPASYDDFRLQGSDGHTYVPSFEPDQPNGKIYDNGRLSHGESLQGWLAFDVPIHADTYTLLWSDHETFTANGAQQADMGYQPVSSFDVSP